MGLLNRVISNNKRTVVIIVLACLFITFFICPNFKDEQQKRIMFKTKIFNISIMENTKQARKYIGNSSSFTIFYGDVNPNAKRPLPDPRSHVITNNSRLINMFARDLGCTRKQTYKLVYQYLSISVSCFTKYTSFSCNEWVWDPANWTLTLTNKTVTSNVYGNHVICAYPIQTDRVAKIVFANGSEYLPGCTSNRSPCAPTGPYFDRELNMRINNSPCCRNMVLRVLADAHDIFEKHKIRYVMLGGAVISVGRDAGQFIPYDTDLDLTVDFRDRDKFMSSAQADMKALGYFFRVHDNGDYVEMCASEDCGPGVDVWFYEYHPTKKKVVKYHGMTFWENPESVLFPTSWEVFAGKKYRFPREIIKYLDHEYSTGLMLGYRNWQDVFLCNYRHGHKCTHSK